MSMAMSTPYGRNQAHANGPAAAPGRRLRDDTVNSADRHMAIAMHLTPFGGFLFLPLVAAPLVLWLIQKDKSVFCDDHGREVVNFGISQLIIFVILCVTFIGLLLVPVQAVVVIVNLIRGAVAAGNGEYFRYPMTFRFLA